MDLAAEVRRTISWLLRGGSASLDETAAVLAMGPRTLQRKLRAAGTDFATLLAEVRAEIVLAYLARGSDQPIGQLTTLLGYSEPSAISRFLKQRFGADGRALRRRLS
jgi:AraC-like DNA-binding protein